MKCALIALSLLALACDGTPQPKETIEARNARIAAKYAAIRRALPPADHLKPAQDLLTLWKANGGSFKLPLVLKGPKPTGRMITPAEWTAARERLKLIPENVPEHAQALDLTRQMDACDVKAAQVQTKLEAQAQERRRVGYAPELEARMVDARMNVDVSATGPAHTVLTIKWILASKVAAHDLSKAGIVDQAYGLGFKKVILCDGHNESYVWTTE